MFEQSYTPWKGKGKSQFSAFQSIFKVFQLQIALDLQLLSWHVMQQLLVIQLSLEALMIFSWKPYASLVHWMPLSHSPLYDRSAIIILANDYLKNSSLLLKLLKGINYRTCSKSAPENISVSVQTIVNHVSARWKCSYIALQSNDVLASWFTIYYLRFFFSNQFCHLKLCPGSTRMQDNRIGRNTFDFLFLLWEIQEDRKENGSNPWKLSSRELFQKKKRLFFEMKKWKEILRYGINL